MAITAANNMRLRDVSLYNELARQINRRIYAVNQGRGTSFAGLVPWTSGTRIYKSDDNPFYMMQNAIKILSQNMVRSSWVTTSIGGSSFVDPDPNRLAVDVTGRSSSPSGSLVFRRATSGTHPTAGFSLSSYDSSFFYGDHDRYGNDMYGPWLFFDLQRYIDFLDTVPLSVMPTLSRARNQANYGDSAWTSVSAYPWTAWGSPISGADCEFWVYSWAQSYGVTSDIIINGLAVNIARSIRVLARADTPPEDYYNYTGGISSPGVNYSLVNTAAGTGSIYTIPSPSAFQAPSFSKVRSVTGKRQDVHARFYAIYTFT